MYMILPELSGKLSKYRLKKKPAAFMEFDESTPFAQSGAEKVFSDGEKINRHSKIASSLILGFIGIVLMQTFRLQIIERNKFSMLAENNRQKEITLRADRGIIYDKNKSVLVKNEAIFDLVGISREIPDDRQKLEKMLDRIAFLTSRPEQEIRDAIAKIDGNSYRAELIAENIDISAAIAIEAEKEDLPGIEVRKNSIRSYPDAEYFSQIIGYTGRVSPEDLGRYPLCEPADFIGKAGLESSYENELRGTKGVEKTEIDAGGKIISVLSKTDAEMGKNLILSLDGALQKKLQDALWAQIKKIPGLNRDKTGAAAVALDPRNGKVLALVSMPSYDNNKFVDIAAEKERDAILNDPGSPLLNRVISGRYPPGSTIKPVMGIAALEEGIINENTIIEDRGSISVPEYGRVRNFYGWNRAGLGPMNIISAIAESSDIFFYTVGGGFGKFIGLGVDRITEYFKKFNLGKKLGIDIGGETEGVVPTREWKSAKYDQIWVPGDTYNLSIGQGYLLVTPLQVASWTEAVANNGTIYKPQLVDKITVGDNPDAIVQEFRPEIIADHISDRKYIEIIRRGMRQAAVSGTARALGDLPVSVAGKTGTAQFFSKGKEMTHSWFASFAPYDSPEIVLVVLIEGGGEGSSTAVPIAKEVLGWYFGDKRN